MHFHPAGDAVLQAFADLLRSHFRSGDSIGRYGGEEFGRATECPCTISVGIAQLTDDLPDYHTWLQEAGRSLYQAKATGRDRIVVGSLAPAPDVAR